MRRRAIITTVSLGLLVFGIIGAVGNHGQSQKLDSTKINTTSSSIGTAAKKMALTCDGTTVTSNCVLDGVSYKTYIYRPAVPEKTHMETETTYQEKVIGYCSLCSDGTYSPSCATGRGTCSHHGGVAQWNAPVTSSVPVQTTKTVVDSPAQEAYFEKVQ